MANNISSGELTGLLGLSLGGVAYTTPPSWYLALDSGTLTNAGTASSEISGYTRQPITWAAASYNAGTFMANVATSNAQTFTSMPAVTVSSVEIYTLATGTARRLWFGNLASPKTTASGDTLSFASGAITATLA